MGAFTIAVISGDESLIEWLKAHTPAPTVCERTVAAVYFSRLARGEPPSALLDESECTAAFAADFRMHARRGVRPPVILVRRGTISARAELEDLGARSLTRSEWQRRGMLAMHGDRICNFRAATIAAVQSEPTADGTMIEIVEEVLTADPPVRSIVELAARMQRERAELSSAWKSAMSGETPYLLLHEFIDVWLVFAAVERNFVGTGWRRLLANSMHVREQRLRVASQQVIGISFAEVCNGRLSDALDVLVQRVLRPMGVQSTSLPSDSTTSELRHGRGLG